jgi:hypothetical protein
MYHDIILKQKILKINSKALGDEYANGGKRNEMLSQSECENYNYHR